MAAVSGRVSVIPPCGDQRWFQRRLLRAVLAGSLAVDFVLVWLFLAVLA
jgi:hypothetical protein